jgi:hypothetical protein
MTNLERNLNLPVIDRQVLVFLLCSVFPGNPEMKNGLRCHCGVKKTDSQCSLIAYKLRFLPGCKRLALRASFTLFAASSCSPRQFLPGNQLP